MATSDAQNPNPEPIWDLPGLSKNEFYAAAYFLSHRQRQQTKGEYTPEESRTPITLRVLLDGLALLFARAKGAGTAANVTAVALEERNSKNKRTLMVHVAKNAGPQSLEGLSDEEFAASLGDWYSRGSEKPHPESRMWQIMARFWGQRVKIYLDTLKRAGAWIHAESELMGQFQGSGEPDKNAFVADFAVLRQYVDACAEESRPMDHVFKLCFALPGASDHRYPKYPGPQRGQKDVRSEGQKLAEKFRKAIKHIKLLRTLRVVWEALLTLRAEFKDTDLQITFRPPRDLLPLPMEPIFGIMETWKATSTGKQTFEKDVSAVVRHYSDQGPVRDRFFHCELQLLELCITAPRPGDFHDYFGCSKLSCALCWQVMTDADYQTKGTHARLYPDCAFPFSVSSADGHCRLAVALKRAQDQFLERILRYSMHPDDKFTQYVARTETNPYAATVTSKLDVDTQISNWLGSGYSGMTAAKIEVPMLKISCDGTWAVEQRKFYKPGKYHWKGVRYFWADGSWWRRRSNGTVDEHWITDLQLRQYKRDPMPVPPPYRPQPIARQTARLEEHRPSARWQWVDFRIALNEREHVYAEIQVLCRLADDSGNQLPANRYCETIVGFGLENVPKCPWRGDLYITGQILIDDGTFMRPSDIRSLNEENVVEFLELFRKAVIWTSWYETTRRIWLYDELERDTPVAKKRFDQMTIPSPPSAEELKDWWNPGVFTKVLESEPMTQLAVWGSRLFMD